MVEIRLCASMYGMVWTKDSHKFAVLYRYQYIIYVNASENLTLSESTGETDDYRQVGVSIQFIV